MYIQVPPVVPVTICTGAGTDFFENFGTVPVPLDFVKLGTGIVPVPLDFVKLGTATGTGTAGIRQVMYRYRTGTAGIRKN